MKNEATTNKLTTAEIENIIAIYGRPDRMPFTQVEDLIKKEIEDCGGRDALEDWEVTEIREEAYTSNGWYEDPFPEELPEEEEEDEEDETSWATMTMSQRLNEVGMRWADFF